MIIGCPPRRDAQCASDTLSSSACFAKGCRTRAARPYESHRPPSQRTRRMTLDTARFVDDALEQSPPCHRVDRAVAGPALLVREHFLLSFWRVDGESELS